MSDFSYYIPQTIRIRGKVYFFKKQLMFVGNSIAAKSQAKKLRQENPNKIIRVCHGTISEYI